jgi:hypothetical protein
MPRVKADIEKAVVIGKEALETEDNRVAAKTSPAIGCLTFNQDGLEPLLNRGPLRPKGSDDVQVPSLARDDLTYRPA